MSNLKDMKIYLNGHEIKEWGEDEIEVVSPPPLAIMNFQDRSIDGKTMDHEWKIIRPEAEWIRDQITAGLEKDDEQIVVMIGMLEVPFNIDGAEKMLAYMTDLIEADDRQKLLALRPKKITGIAEKRELYADGERIPIGPSLKRVRHSPTGFFWGYGGSGPSQTALAIALLYVPEEEALASYMDFKWEIIAKIRDIDFELDGQEIGEWFDAYRERTEV